MIRPLLVAALCGAALGALAPRALAEGVIRKPDAHPVYRGELEPHGIIVLWHRHFAGYYGESGVFETPEFGGGFRASIEVADPAFVPPINNTVGVTFGLDVTTCRNLGDTFQWYAPVGLQWNFWFTEKWGAFFEGGPVIRAFDALETWALDFYLSGGGRYLFTDNVALTMRIGYPFTFVIGPSFFVGE
jgi:hypothetical protein